MKPYKSFQQLPPGYRERAILRFEQDPVYHERYFERDPSLADALLSGFEWKKTKEGYDFWYDVKIWSEWPEKFPLPDLKNEL